MNRANFAIPVATLGLGLTACKSVEGDWDVTVWDGLGTDLTAYYESGSDRFSYTLSGSAEVEDGQMTVTIGWFYGYTYFGAVTKVDRSHYDIRLDEQGHDFTLELSCTLRGQAQLDCDSVEEPASNSSVFAFDRSD